MLIDCRIVILTLALLLTGCGGWAPVAVAPLPLPPLAEQWQQTASSATGSAASTPAAVATPTEYPTDSATENDPDQPWLASFADVTLDALVAEALAANATLAEAQARLREGEGAAQVAGAPRQLQLDAALQAGRARRNSQTANSFSAEFGLSWEADLWGRLSAAAQAAVIDRDALALELRAAQLSLAANVAKAWFAAVEGRQQQGLSEQLVSNLSQSLQVLEEGYRNGLVAALDIHLARANLATERSRLADRRRTLGDQLRALQLLLGRYPSRALMVPAQLPRLPAAVPAGLPSQLLTRRPDIRAAAARLESAERRQHASHQDRFPRFSLSASLGGSSDELSNLLSQQNLFWSLFGNLAQPLLDGGRLEGLERQAAARLEQAQARYVDSLLSAFAEVEGALEQERELQHLTQALELSVQESDLAEALAYEQYRQGLVDIVTALESQRRAFTARSSYIAARNQQLQNRIDLYLALGGDFAAAASPIQTDMRSNDDQS